jgi:hypothetical protein
LEGEVYIGTCSITNIQSICGLEAVFFKSFSIN